MVHIFPLLRAGHQLRHSIRAHRHVGEQPHELRAEIDQTVIVGFTADHIHIFAGIAAACAKEQLPLPQNIHRTDNLLIGSFSAPVIRSIFEAFNRDCGYEILYSKHFVRESFIDQRSISKGQEGRFRVTFAQGDDILLPHQWFTAGINEEVATELLSLSNHTVQLFQCQIQFIAILRCPAAGAVQIAAGCGVHQDGPGNVTVIFGAVGKAGGRSDHTGVDDEILHQFAPLPIVNFRIDTFYQLIPVTVLVQQDVPHHSGLVFDAAALVVLNQPIAHFDGVMLKILIHVFQRLFGSENLETVRNTHDDSLLGMVHSG